MLRYNLFTGSASHYPLLRGIQPGSSIPQGKQIAVSCSSSNASSVQSIQWFLNGRRKWEEKSFCSESDDVISIWVFAPQVGDVVIECKVKGYQEQSAFVFFSVSMDTHTDSPEIQNSAAVRHHYLQLVFLVLVILYDNL